MKSVCRFYFLEPRYSCAGGLLTGLCKVIEKDLKQGWQGSRLPALHVVIAAPV